MIRGSVNPIDLQRLRAKPITLLQALRMRMNVLLLQLQAKIVGEKLQGQVLHHRTGTLQRSIVLDPADGAMIEGTVVTGSVIGATPPASYGKFHEEGTSSAYEIRPVNKKALMWIAAGGAKRFASRVMHPPIKQRSFMSSSLNEMREKIVTDLSQAAAQALRS